MKLRSKSTADTDNESQPLLSSDVSRTSIARPYSIDRRHNSDLNYYAVADYDSENSVGSEPITKLFVREPSKQNSVVTIFAIWNTMMGTSLLAMPWGIERAGLVAGVFLIILMGALCLYTTHCVMTTQKSFGEPDGEISDLTRIMLGPTAQLLARIFSWIVLLGANIVYWILMSNFLFYSVDYLHDTFFNSIEEEVNISSLTDISLPVICPRMEETIDNRMTAKTSIYYKVWSLENTVPLFLAVLITPLLNFKSATR